VHAKNGLDGLNSQTLKHFPMLQISFARTKSQNGVGIRIAGSDFAG